MSSSPDDLVTDASTPSTSMCGGSYFPRCNQFSVEATVEFLNFVSSSPTPCTSLVASKAGFREVSTLLAFTIPQIWTLGSGLSIVATHVDSPNLRLYDIWHSWPDRDLLLKGRIVLNDKSGDFTSKLIKIERPPLRMPTLSIHCEQTTNETFVCNQGMELIPIEIIAHEEIHDFELHLYDTQSATLGGLGNEFVFSDVNCIALPLRSELCFDLTRRISADMSHTIHPKYTTKHEENHSPKMNGGVVIKNAKQGYASDAIATKRGNVQKYEDDTPNVSWTVHVGPMPSKIGVRKFDVACAMLSVHSIRETAGSREVQAATHFLLRRFRCSGSPITRGLKYMSR
ncbi:hypothetical protein BKA93DRAFT_814504 [Sparassis latifolia]